MVGTIFDSTSLFFCMCVFIVLSKPIRFPRLILLRGSQSKRLASAPFILFAYSFLAHVSSAKISEISSSLVRALKSTWPVFVCFLVLIVIFIRNYLSVTNAADFGPYAPKFDVATMIDGAKIYLRYIAFDRLNLDNALLAYLGLTAIALLTWTRIAIFGSVGFLIAASPVLCSRPSASIWNFRRRMWPRWSPVQRADVVI